MIETSGPGEEAPSDCFPDPRTPSRNKAPDYEYRVSPSLIGKRVWHSLRAEGETGKSSAVFLKIYINKMSRRLVIGDTRCSVTLFKRQGHGSGRLWRETERVLIDGVSVGLVIVYS